MEITRDQRGYVKMCGGGIYMPSTISLSYNIRETIMPVDDDEVKVYGVKVVQEEIGVTYTAEINNITSKYDKIVEFVRLLESNRVTYDLLMREVETFINCDYPSIS